MAACAARSTENPPPPARGYPQPRASRRGPLQLFCKKNLTAASDRCLYQPDRRRWRFGGRCGVGTSGRSRDALLPTERWGWRFSVVSAFGFDQGRLGEAISSGVGFGFAGFVLGLAWAVLYGLLRGGFSPLLFDNCIGRKRDVGGGVLAGLCCVGWFSARAGVWRRRWGPKRQLTVTFQNSSRLNR